MATLYIAKMLTLPFSYESWMEGGLYMLTYWAAILALLLPTVVLCAKKAWRTCRRTGRIVIVVAAIALPLMALLLPEWMNWYLRHSQG